MAMGMNKYQKSLMLLNKIESKYGSIVNCPEDDLDYQMIRDMYPSMDHESLANNYKNKIYKLAHEGYSVTEIINKIPGDNNRIINFIKNNDIRLKTVFKYRVVSPAGNTYYITSLSHFINSHFKYTSNSVSRMEFLKSRKYRVYQGKYHWRFIRNGCYYLPPYLDKSVMRTGVDSYVYDGR
ncbi:hypothetical protein ABVC56_00095 [Lactobacillus crispatus]|uniref:hypothetical protein n=2 Tax=Lactobacillus crispatus TaxID=47770 RepID=UPI001F09BC0A|nr:hypothetical protein [Lactobacillus crispatus]